ncbi:MAG: hypothetical protein WC421_10490 [Elusimicrobiales bacterium]
MNEQMLPEIAPQRLIEMERLLEAVRFTFMELHDIPKHELRPYVTGELPVIVEIPASN